MHAFYCSSTVYRFIVWCPWLEGDKNVLEKVQQRMVRLLSDVRGNSYEEKLEKIGLTTLAERRERGDAIEAFKTLNGYNRVKKEKWFQIEEDDARPTRRNTRLEIRRNCYSLRAAKIWNTIPDAVREQRSINAFKNAFDSWKRTSKKKRTRTTENITG